MTGAKSLVLITVDCLRADHTGYMGYERPTTPFLDSLSAESWVFPKAIVAGAPTYYSFPGIMASRFPLALGRQTVGVAPGEPTLASLLQHAGYSTAAYVAANPYLSKRFGYERGFDVFEDFLTEKPVLSDDDRARSESNPQGRTRFNDIIATMAHRSPSLGRIYDDLYFRYRLKFATGKIDRWDALRPFPPADVLVDRAGAWLASLGRQPFFLWLHFMDPHAPYYPPAEALSAMGVERMSPERGRYLNTGWNRSGLDAAGLRKYRDEIVRLYDAGIRWVDTQLARLVDQLRSLSLWESSVFLQTADHGEEFLDHGGRFHSPSKVYQELLHVPLLMRVPWLQAKPLSDAPFSHVNLAPTVLDAMGVEPPPEFEGRSHWADIQTGGRWECAISESVGQCTNPVNAQNRVGGRVMAVQDRRYKLVLGFDGKQEQLFDLKNDPKEQRALPEDAEKPARARLLRAAMQHLERPMRRGGRELALRSRIHELGLEWQNSNMDSKPRAS